MSFFFGGGGKKVKPQFTGLGVQTSSNSVPVPIVFGKTRITHNIIFQGDFKAHKQKQKAGKGMGGSQTTYTYSATFQLGLCWGEIYDVTRVWKDQSKETDYTKLGFTLFTGTANQAPWGYLTTKHPTKALGYPHIAHLDVANYDLGQSNVLQQHSFEVEAPLFDTQVDGSGDADPAQCVDQLLNNELYGVVGGVQNTIVLQNLLSTGAATTTGDNAFQTYCRAMGFGLSPALMSQEDAKDVIQRWADLCNTALVWTGSRLKLISRSSESITAHGVTYLPETTVRYSLTDADYERESGTDPISFERIDPADAYNSIILDVRNRENEYNTVPAEWRDQALIDQYGLKAQDPITAEEVCDPEMGAVMAALIGQRTAYIRNTFAFRLPVSFCRLEPMDILECYDPRWGTFYTRIDEVEEDDEDRLSIVASEYHGSVGSSGPASYVPNDSGAYNSGVTASDVNPPIIFQPPPSLTDKKPQVWAAVSGGDGTTADPYWGGAEVWVSTDGGTSYNMVGTIDAPARMGLLTGPLAAYGGANPDTTNVLEVSSAMSDAEFSDATAADAAAGVTLTYIKAEGANVEEYLSYTTATLTGTSAYDLEDLYRGLNGSVAGAHAAGALFARLDSEAIFKYDFPIELVGETIYIKFVSYNIWGNGYQSLADVTAYTFTIQGGYDYGTTLEELGDVDVVGATDGQNLEYDNTTGKWVAVSPPVAFGFQKPVTAITVSTQTVMFDPPVAVTLPASLTSSQGTIGPDGSTAAAAPSADTDFDIQSPAGTSIGTMRFTSGSLTATFIKATSSSIPLGQPIVLVAPASLNGMAGTIFGSIKGTR